MNIRQVLLRYVSDRTFNVIMFYYMHARYGRRFPSLNLESPRSFNEKIIWLKENWVNPNAANFTDKLGVKRIVTELLGKDHVIPTLKTFQCAEDISLEGLPDDFIIKATHGSGWNLINTLKSPLCLRSVRSRAEEWLKTDYGAEERERHYSKIPRQIIIEPLLKSMDGGPLVDYKIFCFGGRAQFIQVDLDRFSNHTRGFFDRNWERLPFTTLYPQLSREVRRPNGLENMLRIAELLAVGSPFARIDLYEHKGMVLFGEVTFYHGGGFEPFFPPKYDGVLGNMLVLPVP